MEELTGFAKILNDTWGLPNYPHTFEVPYKALSEDVKKLFNPREIFVCCSSAKRRVWLINEFIRCMGSDIHKVDRTRHVVEIGKVGADIWRFVTDEELFMILQGKRGVHIVYEAEVERAIDLLEQAKEKQND